MQVETYEVAELIGEQLEDISSPEAIELIEQLGLDGQKELLSVREVGDGDSVVVRNPYQVMTEEEQRVVPGESSLGRRSLGRPGACGFTWGHRRPPEKGAAERAGQIV